MLKAEKVQEKEKKGSISAFIAFNYLLGVGSNKRDVKGGCCWLFDCLLQLSKAKKGKKKSTKRNKRASKGESLFPDVLATKLRMVAVAQSSLSEILGVVQSEIT